MRWKYGFSDVAFMVVCVEFCCLRVYCGFICECLFVFEFCVLVSCCINLSFRFDAIVLSCIFTL